MLIRLGYDIQFQVAAGAPMIAHLNVHPARTPDLLEPDLLRLDPPVEVEQYVDSFGNLATRFLLPPRESKDLQFHADTRFGPTRCPESTCGRGAR